MTEEIDERKWTNLKFDSQVLSSFMSCPREMNNRFNNHLVPIISTSKGKERGTLIHYALQQYYESMKEGNDFTISRLKGLEGLKKIAYELRALESEDIIDVGRTFEEYVEYRKNDVFQVVFTERIFEFIAYEVWPLRIILTGRIDLGILEYQTQNLIPIDHKSESEKWFYSSLSNQFKIYALACKSQRLIVNRIGFQKSKKAEEKFKREELAFDKDVLDEFANEVLPYYAKQMLIAYEDNYFPPNYSSCIKGHFACIFSDKYNGGICNITRELREQKLNTYFYPKEWDPKNEEL